MKETRTKNAVKNVTISVTTQVVAMLLNFVSRTVFIHCLGNDYLSCEGLLSNVLTILSFSELGIGSAVIYSLYKPLADNDFAAIGKIMNLFAKAYKYIAIAIAVLGCLIFPVVNLLIKDMPQIETDFLYIYLLFVSNTVFSYVCGYKKTLLIAAQKNYIVTLIHQGTVALRIALQVWILLATKNYFLYLFIAILLTITNNIICNIIVNKNFPQINQHKKLCMEKAERSPILKNIAAIFQYKVGAVVLNGTDNIIISAMLTTHYVGLSSNYTLIISAIQGILNQAFMALQASVGNLLVASNKGRHYDTFQVLWIISYWVIGFVAISFLVLLNPFITSVWLSPEYVLPYDSVIALVLSFYILMINTIPSTFRTAAGYFKEAKWCPIYASVLNILLSIGFAKIIGLSGIFFATAISRFVTFNIIDPHYVYKHCFGVSEKQYHLTFLTHTLFLIVNYLITNAVVSLIPSGGLGWFLVKGVVCVLLCNVLIVAFLIKNPYFKQILTLLRSFIVRKEAA